MTMRSTVIAALAAIAIVASAAAQAAPAIHVDIPVKLASAKVVFNIDQPLMSADVPVGIGHMTLMAKRFKADRTKGSIIGIFHSAAGYMLLNDAAYNRVRKIKTGNPYKAMIADLIAKGVQIEECAVTMQHNGWGNADLLPGVKVNGGANLRIVRLVQQGYVMLPP